MKQFTMALLTFSFLLIIACDAKENSDKDNLSTQITTDIDATITSTELDTLDYYMKKFGATRRVMKDGENIPGPVIDIQKWEEKGIPLEDIPALDVTTLSDNHQKMAIKAKAFQQVFGEKGVFSSDIIEAPLNIVFYQSEMEADEEAQEDFEIEVFYTIKVNNVEEFERILKVASAYGIDDEESEDFNYNRGGGEKLADIQGNTFYYFNYLTNHNTQYLNAIEFEMVNDEPIIKSVTIRNEF